MLSTWTSNPEMASGTPESGSSERRRHARYPFTGTLEAFEVDSEARIQGRTADLSEGGCYVDTMSPFPAQTRVKVRVTRNKRSFESQAIVVYSVAGMGMGLRFEALNSSQVMTLKRWLGELSGESIKEMEMEEESAPIPVPADSNRVLNELVSELMRKGVLADEIGRGMLQRLGSAV